MNIIKHNMSKIALCMLFFVVSIQAVDKNELKNSKETNNEKQNNILPAETLPPGYVEPTQPAEGIKFTIPNNQINKIFENNKLLKICASDNIVRLAPPLIIKIKHVDEAVRKIRRSLINYNN